MCGGSEAVERKSERMDTAYSPRLHEEELSATASRILLRVVELWLENHGCGMVESKSCRSCIRPEGWLARGCVAVDSVHIGVGKWLNRQLEFRDEQRMIGSIRDVTSFFMPFPQGLFWYNTPQ